MNHTDGLPLPTLRRLPDYYQYIKALEQEGLLFVSAANIAKRFGLHEVQVRKDLACVSKVPGRPRTGFAVKGLLSDIGDCLGCNNIDDAVLMGVGHMGKALMSYGGFEGNGVRIVAGFDTDHALVGQTFGGKQVFSLEKLPDLCQRMGVHIGVITVPAVHAQKACDLLVSAGILAILNFAPVHLEAPSHVLIQNESVAVSLALLSKHLAERLATATGDTPRP